MKRIFRNGLWAVLSIGLIAAAATSSTWLHQIETATGLGRTIYTNTQGVQEYQEWAGLDNTVGNFELAFEALGNNLSYDRIKADGTILARETVPFDFTLSGGTDVENGLSLVNGKGRLGGPLIEPTEITGDAIFGVKSSDEIQLGQDNNARVKILPATNTGSYQQFPTKSTPNANILFAQTGILYPQYQGKQAMLIKVADSNIDFTDNGYEDFNIIVSETNSSSGYHPILFAEKVIDGYGASSDGTEWYGVVFDKQSTWSFQSNNSGTDVIARVKQLGNDRVEITASVFDITGSTECTGSVTIGSIPAHNGIPQKVIVPGPGGKLEEYAFPGGLSSVTVEQGGESTTYTQGETIVINDNDNDLVRISFNGGPIQEFMRGDVISIPDEDKDEVRIRQDGVITVYNRGDIIDIPSAGSTGGEGGSGSTGNSEQAISLDNGKVWVTGYGNLTANRASGTVLITVPNDGYLGDIMSVEYTPSDATYSGGSISSGLRIRIIHQNQTTKWSSTPMALQWNAGNQVNSGNSPIKMFGTSNEDWEMHEFTAGATSYAFNELGSRTTPDGGVIFF